MDLGLSATQVDDLHLSQESGGFVQHSDDEEQLWEVDEILQEKNKKFLVRWKVEDEGVIHALR